MQDWKIQERRCVESRQTENKNSQHFKLKVGRLGAHWCQAQQNYLAGFLIMILIAGAMLFIIKVAPSIL